MKNYDAKTVEDFGDEWSRFPQDELSQEELKQNFDHYFSILDWERLPRSSECLDIGCGSGRWAKLVAPRVGTLHCIDASNKALEVAKEKLYQFDNCYFHCESVDNLHFEDNSMDFVYSLGVLHHLPDPYLGIKSCVNKIKPGGIFLAYIYYAFDDKPIWFRLIWKGSDLVRIVISRLPFKIKAFLTSGIAYLLYYPLSKVSKLLDICSFDVANIPLSHYRNMSFYSMKTDALDRFGTRLEKRYKKSEIRDMLERAGLESIHFSEKMPYWCVIGYKKSS